MGFNAWPLSRYRRNRPSSRTSTRPTSRRTLRCLETCGWPSRSCPTRSPTGRSPARSTSKISRRRGSATALNTSAVVAALATTAIIFLYGNVSRREDQLRGLERDLELRAVPDAVEDDPVRVRQLALEPRRGRGPRKQLVLGAPEDPQRAVDRAEGGLRARCDVDHAGRVPAQRGGADDVLDGLGRDVLGAFDQRRGRPPAALGRRGDPRRALLGALELLVHAREPVERVVLARVVVPTARGRERGHRTRPAARPE